MEDWDAVLLQEISFRDESFDFEALEASLGGHKLVLSSSCPWDTAIVIHSRWKASLRWFASSCHSVWVGFRATEEFTFCSIHLPGWVDDDTFEKTNEESLDAGRGRAGGSIFFGVDAKCDVDNVLDQKGSLVRDLCCYQGLFPLFQSRWTLSWLSPDGSLRKKKVDFVFTNQKCASVSVFEDLHLGSDHKPLCVSRRRVDGVMLEFTRKRRSLTRWVLVSLSQHHEFQNFIARHVVLGSTIGQRVLESMRLRAFD